MSLSDLAALGSFVSGIAVLASLGFLYFQMRQVSEQIQQNERNQRAANAIEVGRDLAEFTMRMMQPEMARIQLKMYRGDDDFSDVELQQALNLVQSYLTNALRNIALERSGLVDKQMTTLHDNVLRLFLAQPSTRAMWPLIRQNMPEESRAQVERIIAEEPTHAPMDLLAYYRARLAKLKAAAQAQSHS